ncbi:sulfatase [uncultured Draconibacterium sp.]|uniref:sulfatase family protein n=1 Tax=uncultured Draconibacterium sp. TaxID=1573823 RepID=UPI0029C054E2|nr:sulfatase [uncultured Draconibacterium sp.]
MKNYITLVYFVLMFVFATGCTSNTEKEAPKPNILLAIADDVSYPHMGAYGCSWVSTPAFDKIAEQGVLFNNAYTPNAKCAPSRACILTGRNSWQLEEACNHMPYFPIKFKSFPEALADNGYHVGYTGKGWVPGVAYHEDGSKRDLLVNAYRKIKTTPPTTEISVDDYSENFKSFLSDNKENKPFFFWYGGWEPHRAYEYASGLKYGKKLAEIDKVFDFWPDNDSVRTDMLDYAFELEYFDKQLQKILTTLEEKDMLDNTIVIVTADNGMPFPRIKGQEYEMSNHLPLTIMWKDGIKHVGRSVDDFVKFTDIAPTLLELCGITNEESGMKPFYGMSLTDIILSNKSGKVNPERDHVLIGKERHDIGRPNNQGYPIRGIRKGDFLYLRNFKTDRWPVGNPETGYLNCDGSPTKTVCLETKGTKMDYIWQLNFNKRTDEELYNVSEDPFCMKNLAEEEKYAAIKAQMSEQMINELTEQEDPRILGNGDVFDSYKVYPPKLMNYYERYTNGEETPTLHWVNNSDYQNQ